MSLALSEFDENSGYVDVKQAEKNMLRIPWVERDDISHEIEMHSCIKTKN